MNLFNRLLLGRYTHSKSAWNGINVKVTFSKEMYRLVFQEKFRNEIAASEMKYLQLNASGILPAAINNEGGWNGAQLCRSINPTTRLTFCLVLLL